MSKNDKELGEVDEIRQKLIQYLSENFGIKGSETIKRISNILSRHITTNHTNDQLFQQTLAEFFRTLQP